MASGNQLIQDYATIANQLGDYFNTITINVSSISTFGTLGSVGNLLTLSPDGGSVDIATLPNLVNLNSNTSGLTFNGAESVFGTDTKVVGHYFQVDNLGGFTTTITGGDVVCSLVNANNQILASNTISCPGTITGGTIATSNIIDISSNTFFSFDSITGNTSTIATCGYFSTLSYNELVPPPVVNVPTTFFVGTSPVSIYETTASNANLIGHTPFYTCQPGYITANATIQFENTANSQNYPVGAFMRLTDASGSVLYYQTEPIYNLVQARHTAFIPGYANTSLLLRSSSNMPIDTYNLAVYAFTDSSNATLTSSRCDILASAGYQECISPAPPVPPP